MATTTAFTNATEAAVINHLLRNTSFGPFGGNGTTGTQLYLALMSNITSDAALAEIASGTGGYSARIAIGTSQLPSLELVVLILQQVQQLRVH